MEKLLKADEAAEKFNLTKPAFYMAVSRGQIPAVRLGKRRLRFRESELEAILKIQTAAFPRPNGGKDDN